MSCPLLLKQTGVSSIPDRTCSHAMQYECHDIICSVHTVLSRGEPTVLSLFISYFVVRASVTK